MAMANKSGWPEWFAVANQYLMYKIGVTENTLIKHRNILIQKGRIEYKSAGKQKPGKYKIISFTSNIEVKREVKENLTSINEVKGEVSYEVSYEVNREVSYSALNNKLNKTKLNETNNKRTISPPAPDLDDFVSEIEDQKAAEPAIVLEAFRIYEKEGFGLLSATLADKLGDMVDTYSDRWVCEALKVAVVQGKRNLGYVGAILRNWHSSGVDEPWTQKRSSSKPTSANAGQRPKLATVQPTKGESMSDQELRELHELARKLDLERKSPQEFVQDDEDGWR